MKVQTKTALLLLAVFLVFAAFAVWSGLSEINKENIILKQKVAEKSKLFDEIMELKGSSLKSHVFDYTFWDEMVEFVEGKKDRAWAVENIDASFLSFKDNAAWVYSKNYELLYSTNNLGDNAITLLPVPAGAIEKLFANSRFCHFYANTANGVMEIRGSTIHPTRDPDKKTEPRGYFFAGVLWDAKYIAHFSLIFDGIVEIIPIEGETKAGVFEHGPETGMIHFTKVLPKWDGTPLANVHVDSRSESLRIIYEGFKNQLAGFVFFVFTVLIILVLALLRWVNRPLRLIWNSLENQDVKAIEPILKQKSEYGRIAGLIQKSFEQRTSLENEIAFRKLAEEQLRYAKDQMEILYRLVPSAIFTVDKQRRVTSWNNRAAELTGYQADEVQGRECFLFADKPCKDKCGLYSDDVQKPIRGKECTIMRKDGQFRIVSKNADFLKDPDGTIVGGIESFEDITELKHAQERMTEWSRELEEKVKERTVELKKSQEKLNRSEKLALIGQLSSQVSHELRTPLTAIKNAAYLININMEQGKTEKIGEYVDLISKEVDVTVQVISNTLGFAKSKQLVRKESNLGDVVKESIAVSVVPEKIKVVVNYNEGLPRITIDPVQIRQVFNNIIKNAVDAMSGGGVLTVTLSADEASQIIEIRDTGIGIPKENMEKIFDPLFSTSPRGTGLGLPVCQQIVESHGGSIDVESEVGRGATFRVRLPLK